MRVLHLPYTYFPDPVGGTEVYVAQLARELRARSVESVVAAPGNAAAEYEHEGTRVLRYAVGEPADRREIYDAAGNADAIRALDAILASVRPDVAHFHAYTRGVPPEAANAARRRGVRVVVTYHTPTVTCARGSLIRNGEVLCDGALYVSRCARCMLRRNGLPAIAADVLGYLPVATGHLVRSIAPRAGGVATALRMTELMDERHERVRAHFRAADAVVAPATWVAELLTAEGVSSDRLVVSAQGIQAEPRAPVVKVAGDRAVRVVLPGRYSPEKGIDTVIDAMKAIPTIDIRLDIVGTEQGEEGRRYRRAVEERARGDARIRCLGAIAQGSVVETLADYDAVLVPSLVKETGPLAALEAFAAGVPVIGSALGGIPERVIDGVSGLLVAAGDVAAWASALERFASDGALRATLSCGVRPPRKMSDVAAEMSALYQSVAGPSPAASIAGAAELMAGTR
ncbi:MAG: glycosyltransferase [Gemmatimonadaceae bacterium]